MITNVTAIAIATNSVKCEAGGPDAFGKYSGWILHEDGQKPILNTESIYDSDEEAIKAVQNIVENIRNEF